MLYLDCRIASESVSVILRASKLRKQQAFSYWDSLLSLPRWRPDAQRFTSEDMQHGQIVEGQLRIINPLVRV